MDTTETVRADPELKLSESFNKRHSFNVSNCSTQFDDTNFWLFSIFCDRDLGHFLNPFLNGISYVRNNYVQIKVNIMLSGAKNQKEVCNLELFSLDNLLCAPCQ